MRYESPSLPWPILANPYENVQGTFSLLTSRYLAALIKQRSLRF